MDKSENLMFWKVEIQGIRLSKTVEKILLCTVPLWLWLIWIGNSNEAEKQRPRTSDYTWKGLEVPSPVEITAEGLFNGIGTPENNPKALCIQYIKKILFEESTWLSKLRRTRGWASFQIHSIPIFQEASFPIISNLFCCLQSFQLFSICHNSSVALIFYYHSLYHCFI